MNKNGTTPEKSGDNSAEKSGEKALENPVDMLTEKDGYQEEGCKKEEGIQEIGGPKGAEPTRFGDWERNGRCSDF